MCLMCYLLTVFTVVHVYMFICTLTHCNKSHYFNLLDFFDARDLTQQLTTNVLLYCGVN